MHHQPCKYYLLRSSNHFSFELLLLQILFRLSFLGKRANKSNTQYVILGNQVPAADWSNEWKSVPTIFRQNNYNSHALQLAL